MKCIWCGSDETICYDDGNYKCVKCGHVFNDLVYREPVKLALEPVYKSKCIICGYEKEVLAGVFEIFVCDSCKDAIMRLRAMLNV